MTRATMETDKGTINLELFEVDAPNTVKNFIDLSKKGFYNGLAFHRVIPNFVPRTTGSGGSTDSRTAIWATALDHKIGDDAMEG